MGGSGAKLRNVQVPTEGYQFAAIDTAVNRASFQEVQSGFWQMSTYFGGGEIEQVGPNQYVASAWNGRESRDWFTNRTFASLNDAKRAIRNAIIENTTQNDV